MRGKTEKMRRALMRSNTRRLLSAVALLEFLAMLLVALQPGEGTLQPWLLTLAIPLCTILVTNLMGKIWPVDRAILILTLLLCGVGLIALSDICKSESTPRTQAIYAAAGVAAMFIGAAIVRGLSNWKRITPVLMALCLLALLSPWAIGRWQNGARNWIVFGPSEAPYFSLQPSEFMKPVLIAVLASCFSNRPRFVRCLPGIGFAALCCAVLLTERDLGAVLLYFLTTVLMYYAATSNAALSLAGLGMGAGAAVIAYNAFPYVQDRVAIWQNPWSDPLDAGYQIVRALAAIGSGGLFGMGMGQGRQKFAYLPYPESDFIFAIVGEDFGLIGCLTVIALFVLFVLAGLRVSLACRDRFGCLLGTGITSMIGLQAFINMGVVTGILPTTGLPLPFFSAGGTSVSMIMAAVGILLSISRENGAQIVEASDRQREGRA